MRLARKHERVCFYANYVSKTQTVDADGHKTGEYKLTYTKPKMARFSVGLPSGDVTYNSFGQNLEYDKELKSVDHTLDISESSILWIDTKPTINQDGTTNTPHDYIVKAIRKNLNITAIAVSKVVVK